jgi:carbonic anhydrase/acetyltransferase-like protein (isoleucine patch superfamily)
MEKLTYKLTDETKKYYDITLHRIEAIVDIPAINVKKGDKGGWLEKAYVGDYPVIQDNAWVYDNARVYDDARVSGDALVYGDAEVYGNARVYDNARVYGNARVYDNAEVYGYAWVYGYALVYGDARVYGYARVSGNARVYGYARVSLKKEYTKGKFIYSSDENIKTTIIDQSKESGFSDSQDYKNMLVIGDYEIKDIDEPKKETINIGGTNYEINDELIKVLKDLKESK